MNTRRCPRCGVLWPENEQVCPQCGRTFSGSTWEPEWEAEGEPLTASSVSLPSASPHIAGHYSGLHPEDQPYLSKSMRMRELEKDRTKLGHQLINEDTEIVPPVQQDDFLEQSAQRSIFAPEPVQSARRFVRRSSSNQYMQREETFSAPKKRPSFPLFRIPFFSHKKSTILTLICIVSLLTASVVAFLLIGKHDSDASFITATSIATGSRQSVPTLQLVQKNCDFAGAAPGVVSSQNILLRNSGSGTVTWQASSNSTWLQVSPHAGSFASSQDVRVTVNRGKLTAQAYTGLLTFIQKSGQASHTLTVVVHMSVTSSGSLLALSTTNLTYAAMAQQSPASQVIRLSNNVTHPQNWTVSAETDDGVPWLTLSALSGLVEPGASQTISVGIQSLSLAVGTYHGTLTFHGDISAQVAIVLTVSAPTTATIVPGQLSTSVASLTFSAASATSPASQQITLSNTGGVVLDWSLTATTDDGVAWLNAMPQGGTLAAQEQDTITVSADTTNLQAGTYQGTLTFTSQANAVSVPLTLTVTAAIPPAPAPVISTQTNGLSFLTSEDAKTNPLAQTITFTNTGNAPLHWQAIMNPNALSVVTPASGVLNAGQSATLTVNVPITTEEPGVVPARYTDTITLSDSSLSIVAQKSIAVSITIQPASTGNTTSNASASPGV